MIAIQNSRIYSAKQLSRLITIEYLCFFIAFIVCILLSSQSLVIRYIELFVYSLIFSFVGIASLGALRLYQTKMNMCLVEQYIRLFAGLVIFCFALNITLYWFSDYDLGKYIWLYSILLASIFLVISRTIFKFYAQYQTVKPRAIILGTGNKALQLKNCLDSQSALKSECGLSSEIVGYVHKIGDRERIAREEMLNITINKSPTNNILDYCLSNNIQTIVVAVDDRRSNFPLTYLLECKQNGIVILELAEFYEQELGVQQLDVLDPSWMIYSNNLPYIRKKESNKYALDFGAALICLVLISPIFLLASMLLKINLGAKNKLFTTKNIIGIYSRPCNIFQFNCYKNEKLILMGRVIRKLNLGNLPVLFNILLGEISFVGPQITNLELSSELSTNLWYYKQRFSVKPGLVSWGYNEIDFAKYNSNTDKSSMAKKQLQYDLFYIKKRDCMFDILVMLKKLAFSKHSYFTSCKMGINIHGHLADMSINL